jgi:hypothetical protein
VHEFAITDCKRIPGQGYLGCADIMDVVGIQVGLMPAIHCPVSVERSGAPWTGRVRGLPTYLGRNGGLVHAAKASVWSLPCSKRYRVVS